MKLSSEEKARVVRALPRKNCYFCNGTSFNVGHRAFALVAFLKDDNVPGGIDPQTIAPVITVSCATCGHVQLFSAQHFDIMGPSGSD